MRFFPFVLWFAVLGAVVHWRDSLIPVLGWLFVAQFAVIGVLLGLQELSEARRRGREMSEAEVLAWLERNAWHPELGDPESKK